MEEEIITELKRTLPDKLEQIRKFIDELLINKNSQRLTNVEYQQELKTIRCPKCHGQGITKNGHKHGIQRYVCKKCNYFFSETTDTILSYSKINYKQLKSVISGILASKPVIEISKDAGLTATETYYLEIKIFASIDKIVENTKLHGIVQADEKYFRISFKGTKKENMPRKSRHSGSQNLAAGISNEQVCVVVAIDEYDNIVMTVAGNGQVTQDMISKSLHGKIEEKSILVTDSKSSYRKFANDENLVLKQIPAGEHTIEEIYNLGEVNSLINEIDNYINRIKKGISTRHLQQYLNYLKYRKILKYTFEYLERNEKMYKDCITLVNKLKNRDISKMALPIDISNLYQHFD